jgi:hypothetical protein
MRLRTSKRLVTQIAESKQLPTMASRNAITMLAIRICSWACWPAGTLKICGAAQVNAAPNGTTPATTVRLPNRNVLNVRFPAAMSPRARSRVT